MLEGPALIHNRWTIRLLVHISMDQEGQMDWRQSQEVLPTQAPTYSSGVPPTKHIITSWTPTVEMHNPT